MEVGLLEPTAFTFSVNPNAKFERLYETLPIKLNLVIIQIVMSVWLRYILLYTRCTIFCLFFGVISYES